MIIEPGDSFINNFNQLNDGEILCLNYGEYQQAMDIPSNLHVRALNDGMALINGNDVMGEAWTGDLVQMKGENSSVPGLKVFQAGTNSDACFISGSNNSLKSISCSHGDTHKHKIPVKIDGSGHFNRRYK